ncbi:MAG: hypothetical protein PHW10_02955 [Candidatus Peribacteraceae bacterium]|nr:hypothetical protein [Candidatus Peribacteraceae bacterium]
MPLTIDADSLPDTIEVEIAGEKPEPGSTAWQQARVDIATQLRFPGEHVRYQDQWTKETPERLQREILAHSPDAATFFAETRRQITTLTSPSDAQTRFFIHPNPDWK